MKKKSLIFFKKCGEKFLSNNKTFLLIGRILERSRIVIEFFARVIAQKMGKLIEVTFSSHMSPRSK